MNWSFCAKAFKTYLMKIEVREEPTTLEEYAAIPIKFEVSKVFEVADQRNGSGHFVLSERRLDIPYIKDYDAIEGEHPTQWAGRFDISNWGIFGARVEGRRVGGAAVAFNSPGLDMLEGFEDLAVLWDIRVSPEARGQGIGSALFRAAEQWSIARGCRQLIAETQNINVAACRFYARQGCVLTVVRRTAYPSLPSEVQFIWHRALLHDGTGPSQS
jgi:GNAT superfamily N-acetyltransferase